jgi:hypothetical protein
VGIEFCVLGGGSFEKLIRLFRKEHDNVKEFTSPLLFMQHGRHYMASLSLQDPL